MSHPPTFPPVLMYHALLERPATGLPAVHIEVALFEQHLAWLHAQGYATVTVAELYRRWRANGLSDRLIALTFDDGYRSVLDHAVPALKKYGFVATLFLTTGFVGQPDFARGVPAGDRPLSWAEVRALQAAGWAIEAHSRCHPPHAGLPAARLRQELVESRQAILDQLGTPADYYAFPYGSYDQATLRGLLAAGYAAVFGARWAAARRQRPAAAAPRGNQHRLRTRRVCPPRAHWLRLGGGPLAGRRARCGVSLSAGEGFGAGWALRRIAASR